MNLAHIFKPVGVAAILALGTLSVFCQEQDRTLRNFQVQQQSTLSQRRRPTQIVSVVHRISGPMVLSLLRKNGEIVEPENEDFLFTRTATTNVLAGFQLGDGKTVALWLPKTEADWLAGLTQTRFADLKSAGADVSPAIASNFPEVAGQPENELTIINESGNRLVASLIGIDGGTGLCFVRVRGGENIPQLDFPEARIRAGQRVRIVFPKQADASKADHTTPGMLMLTLEESSALVRQLVRGNKNSLSAVIVDSPGITQSSVGGVVVSETGQTIGIVDTVQGSNARIIPVSVVRNAATRTTSEHAGPGKPWLGVRGEALWSAPNGKLEELGWNSERAKDLAKLQGVLLTSIAPGTPAFDAKLLPGDVIVSINGQHIATKEDFSNLLSTVNNNAMFNLGLLRPTVPNPMSVTIQPVVVADPVTATIVAERRALETAKSRSGGLIGVQTFQISDHTASRLGASGGVFVLSVEPWSTAFPAGLRSEDIIEEVNGTPAKGIPTEWTPVEGVFKLTIVREMKKLDLVIRQDASVQ